MAMRRVSLRNSRRFHPGGKASDDSDQNHHRKQEFPLGFPKGGGCFPEIEWLTLNATDKTLTDAPGGNQQDEQHARYECPEEEICDRDFGCHGIQDNGKAQRKQQSDGT
jgi:hypothetical protein